MYAKRIIPCLDVKDGRVVKGTSFVNLRDAGDPVECAKIYDKEGADELVLLDITASSDARNIIVDIVRAVADSVFIPFTVGGGIRTVEDFTAILRAGADKVSVNSAAVHRPEIINEAAFKFGSQCVVTAIDAKRRENHSGWDVYINGGRINTGIEQGDTSLTTEMNLSLALENNDDVENVDFTTVWEQGHTMAERTGSSVENLIDWIDECCK